MGSKQGALRISGFRLVRNRRRASFAANTYRKQRWGLTCSGKLILAELEFPGMRFQGPGVGSASIVEVRRGCLGELTLSIDSPADMVGTFADDSADGMQGLADVGEMIRWGGGPRRILATYRLSDLFAEHARRCGCSFLRGFW